MTTTLFKDGTVYGPRATRADWLLVRDGKVENLGSGDTPQADRIVSLDGGVLVAGFRDAHVHLPTTGLYLQGLDLRGERSADRLLARLKDRAAEDPDAILFAGNFEDPLDKPLTRHELDKVVGERPAVVARADMHSGVVSTALLEKLDVRGLQGVDVDEDGELTGYLREQAAAAAWTWFDRHLTPVQQGDAVRAAVDHAYSKGVVEVHEMFVVEWRGWDSADVFREIIRDLALEVTLFLGTSEVAKVKEMGFNRIGGDFFLDGSFGSHTAWMKEPFTSPPPEGSPACGISYRSDEELFGFFSEAQRAGLQVGVHAIGDAAIEQAITTWERVAVKVGRDSVAGLQHRIEHFECATDDHIARAGALGLHASVQPAFDRYWGGEDGLYSDRIGWERARQMNRFGSMLGSGLEVAAGSDSTVTPLDPFLQMASLRAHHVASECLSPATALELNTSAPAHLVGAGHIRGSLAAGRQADLAWLDRDPLVVEDQDLLDTEVRGTWIAGDRVWPPDQAETP